MATLEEMARLEAEMLDAEAEAVRNLAEHLRGAVLGLPSQSRLAMTFAKASRKFDGWAASRGHEAEMAHLELDSLQHQLGIDFGGAS